MSINDEKIELRMKIRRELEELPQSYIDLSDEKIADIVINSEAFKNAERVFAYCSVDREVKTEKIILEALRQGKTVALPQSLIKSQMIFREIKSLDGLKVGRYGIPEPTDDCPELTAGETDLALVPALCCDRSFNRLGNGAGYYDRWLRVNRPYSICLCRSELLQEKVPTDEYDYKVCAYADENEIKTEAL